MEAVELKEALKRLGLTQRAFAVEMGYTPEHVNRMVQGKKQIRPVTEKAIERLLRESER